MKAADLIRSDTERLNAIRLDPAPLEGGSHPPNRLSRHSRQTLKIGSSGTTENELHRSNVRQAHVRHYGVSNKNVKLPARRAELAGRAPGHARENGHPSWIPSFEGMTNENSCHQGAGNLETQGRHLPCYYARYPAAGHRSRANVFEASFGEFTRSD
jgi:MoaA/NifB/PqqE/SkfB family radical SAM enzyme